mmetsp:Transcript_89977/g.263005  ORF Transcript_89977/g.263005 Transcript_89977/m.263005 type:complete len:205 (-) Transcript_89977:965-1579(-)
MRRGNPHAGLFQRGHLDRAIKGARRQPQWVNAKFTDELAVSVCGRLWSAPGHSQIPPMHTLVGAHRAVLARRMEVNAGHPILLLPERSCVPCLAHVPQPHRPVMAATEEDVPVMWGSGDRDYSCSVPEEGALPGSKALRVQTPCLQQAVCRCAQEAGTMAQDSQGCHAACMSTTPSGWGTRLSGGQLPGAQATQSVTCNKEVLP